MRTRYDVYDDDSDSDSVDSKWAPFEMNIFIYILCSMCFASYSCFWSKFSSLLEAFFFSLKKNLNWITKDSFKMIWQRTMFSDCLCSLHNKFHDLFLYWVKLATFT